jgi:hypothetical protein
MKLYFLEWDEIPKKESEEKDEEKLPIKMEKEKS